MKNLFLYFILVVTMSNCCKKEHIDPCKDQYPVTANFKVYEDIWHQDEWKDFYIPYESDTFYSKAKFIADEENAKYTWLIGIGVYNTKEVNIDFTGVPINTVIPITLIVEKSPNKDCFKDDDGRDTFTKDIVNKNHISTVGLYEASDPDDQSKKWNFSFTLDTLNDPNKGFNGFTNIPKNLFKATNYNWNFIAGHKEAVYSLSDGVNWAYIRLFWQYDNQWDCYVYYGPWNANATRDFSNAKSYTFRATKIK